jgi:hypothetical protein
MEPQKPITEAQVTAMALEEFYEKTQVMIGEAISGSEVSALVGGILRICQICPFNRLPGEETLRGEACSICWQIGALFSEIDEAEE